MTAASAAPGVPQRRVRPSRGALLIGQPFDLQGNGMNLVRLVLASAVLFHHSFPLIGIGGGPKWGVEEIGGWAVIGFFCLSGYLITASRRTKSLGDYLTLRIARIYPAFLVCLAVTAFLFAPFAWWRTHGTLDGLFSVGTSSVAYLWNNIGLKMVSWDVAGTPSEVPYPSAWNGSLWSLYYEFLCYLVVAFLGIWGLARKSPWPIIGAWFASVLFWVTLPHLDAYYRVGSDFWLLGKLLPYFLAGGVLQMVRTRIGMHGGLALAAAGVFVGAVTIDPQLGGQVASIFGAYTILWVSHVCPSPAWVRGNDISYGVYIYAFQVQQLLAVMGAVALGYWGYSVLALAVTIPFALASWYLLERPVMLAARRSVSRAPASTP